MAAEVVAKKRKSSSSEEKKEKKSKRKAAEEAGEPHEPSHACGGARCLGFVPTTPTYTAPPRGAAETPVVAGEVKKAKKVKKEKSDSDAAAAAPAAAAEPAAPAANPLALDNFKLSEPVKSLLRAKGIQALFEIQAQCMTPLLEGNDVVGRARTGCGKTLAFVLPIVERLCAGATAGKRTYGRAPSVVVLAPTRELAKQVGRLAG